jgi:hypothetical protein
VSTYTGISVNNIFEFIKAKGAFLSLCESQYPRLKININTFYFKNFRFITDPIKLTSALIKSKALDASPTSLTNVQRFQEYAN